MWRFNYMLFFFVFASAAADNDDDHGGGGCPLKESIALLQFKQSFSIESSGDAAFVCGASSPPKTQFWNTNTTSGGGGGDCCKWDGIMCDEHTGHVTGVDLSCSHLLGTIHPNTTLFHLSHLKMLNLAFNDFSLSHIPPTIGSFASTLTHLNLSNSGFSGQIPSEISLLSGLTSLDLSGNDLRFSPNAFSFNSLLQNLTRLTHVFLAFVSISSVLPSNVSSSSLTSLDLSGTGLHGILPDKFFHQLPNLEKIDLSDNEELTGNIPRSIDYLKSLNYFSLSSCYFTGSIPDSIGSLKQLTYLDLSYNNLQGPFPSSVLNLTNLVELDFSFNSLASIPFPLEATHGLQNLIHLLLMNNNLTGNVPSWLFALPSLVYLGLTSNQLSGPVHDFQSRSLEVIDLSSNNFHGPIPQSISKLLNLSFLRLSRNNLSGVVEPDMFSSLVNLQYLDLSYNSLSVSNLNATLGKLDTLLLSAVKIKEFPKFLMTCKSLMFLDLSRNKIRGQIPNWVLSMWGDSLVYLNLSHNSITGAKQLPWKNLEILDLRSNLFGESFPLSICDMTNLEILDMAYNNMGGVIHECLGNFSNRLTVVNLRANRLFGTIPTTFSEENSLRNLNFNGNWLEGSLPRSLIHCKHLQVLDLGNNHLNDTFPNWLETLPDLQILVLRSNILHGPIWSVASKINQHPFPKLRILDLSQNAFIGLLPTKYISSFVCMRSVNQSITRPQYMAEQYIGRYYQGYYDTMTIAMKGHEQDFDRILTIFTAVDFSSNKFQGEISCEIGYLKPLKVLNLSHNSLTGQIPSVLANLSELESLDLSSNQLIGRIPQQLAVGLNALATLNLSLNHLVGPIPRGPQFNTFDNDSYIGNSGLCGFPMLKSCNTSDDDHEATPPPPISDDDDFENGFTWKEVLMGYGTGTTVGLVMGYLMLLMEKPKWLIEIVKAEEYKILNIRGRRRA